MIEENVALEVKTENLLLNNDENEKDDAIL